VDHAGRTVIAPLPAGVTGHFGPELRRFVPAQYHQGQVTLPRLVEQPRAIGVSISKWQVMRLLIAGQDDFLAEARDVLRAGLQTAGWVTVDDTGARHMAGYGFCTNVQLTSAETGTHLWSDRFDEKITDLAAGQELVVTRMKDELGISIMEIESALSLRDP
jgi:hypothetical protein